METQTIRINGKFFLAMSGKIHRFKKERDYVQLDTHALRNPALSFKAKGLHSYLLQLPENWQVNIADLSRRSTDGRDSVSTGIWELIDAGYIVRERALDENGLFAGYDYNVFEQPEHAETWKSVNGKSVNGKSVNGKSVNGKSVTNNNEGEQELSETRMKEEKPASRFSSSSENEKSNLEAKKEKTPPPSSAPPPPKKDYGNLCPDCHGAGWHLGRSGRETCETCLGNGLNSERLLHPPFTPIGTIEPQPPKVVRLYDNELPGVTVVDSVPGTYETKRGKSQRRNEPHIHPENETCFSYFSDPAKARAAWKDWIDYKYEQHRERYKAAKSELSKLRQLFKQFSGDSEKFEAAVNHSIGNLYKGVFPPKQEKENGQFQHLDKAQQQHLKLARFVADLRNGSAFADAGKVDYVTGEKPV